MLRLVIVLGLLGISPVMAGAAGFNATQVASDYDNDLRLAFSCPGADGEASVPAKLKNITWKIKGNAPTTNVQKGLVQTDQDGLATIKINSDAKDLEGVSIVIGIGEEKLNVLVGNGPYTFDELPMSACKLSGAL